MIDTNSILDLIATYRKYGWVLRRVLLTVELRTAIGGAAATLFGSVPILNSDLDAAWFSRPPGAAPVPWEIRHLSTNPYALVESVDENSPSFEEQLTAVERRLRTAVRRIS